MKWRACLELDRVAKSFEVVIDEPSGLAVESLHVFETSWGLGAVVVRPHLGSRVPEFTAHDFESPRGVRAFLRSTETLLAGIVVLHRASVVYLFRDAFGRLPLSYTIHNGKLKAGNPAGGLVEEPVPDHAVLSSFAGFGRSIDERDFFEGVFRVRAGELIVISSNGTRENHLPLWGSPLKPRLEPRDPDEVHARLGEYLTQGSDTYPSPVALSLSSGVDSSTLFRLLNPEHAVETYTMVAPGYAFDESARVREELRDNPPAAAFEFDITEHAPSLDPVTGWPTVIDSLDGPSPHPGTSYELAFQEFVGQRHTALISGLGADQLFAWDPTSWLLEVVRTCTLPQALNAWTILGSRRPEVARVLMRDLPAVRRASNTGLWRVLRRLRPAMVKADPWRQAFRWVSHDAPAQGHVSGVGQYLRHDTELFLRRNYRMEHRSGVAFVLPFLRRSLWESLGHAPPPPTQAIDKWELRLFLRETLNHDFAFEGKTGTFDSFIEDAFFPTMGQVSPLEFDLQLEKISIIPLRKALLSAYRSWTPKKEPVLIGTVWRSVSTIDWLRKLCSLKTVAETR